MGNYVQLDKAKDVVINEEGKLLVNGTRPLVPDIDEDTGLKVFKVRSDKAIGEKDTRFVHVEVFRHFGNIPSCPFLDPEDVAFLDEKKRNPYHVNNLALSDSGREKVFGGDAITDTADGADEEAITDSADEDLTAEGAEDAEGEEAITDFADDADVEDEGITDGADGADEEEKEGSSGEAQVASAQGDEDLTTEGTEDSEEEGAITDDTDDDDSEGVSDSADEDTTEKVFEAHQRGGYYDILDPATGESILEDFGRDKLLRKSDIPEFAEEHSIEVNIL